MSGTILTFAIGYAQVVLALAGCLAGLRILRGPRAQTGCWPLTRCISR